MASNLASQSSLGKSPSGFTIGLTVGSTVDLSGDLSEGSQGVLIGQSG
jgi:hypothetical protein